jgi:hypothetical protein
MIVNQPDPALQSCFVLLHTSKAAAGLGCQRRLFVLAFGVRRSIRARYRRGHMLIAVLLNSVLQHLPNAGFW